MLSEEMAEAFALSRPECQELEPEFLPLRPPDKRALDSERPLIVGHEEPYLDRGPLFQVAGAEHPAA